jgi:hypothetical protein
MTKTARDPRVVALKRFAISITVFNIAGYAFLGFEQPWLWPLLALATGYALELFLEMVAARVEGRAPRFAGNGRRGLMEFLYPAHITSLAVNMLLYVNDRVLVMLFGVMVGISGKWLLRVPVRGRLRHYMNPSNLGISVVLLLLPWASIAPPYHFTEYLTGIGDWVVPAIILASGTMLNAMLTRRMWLIAAWLGGFALQAVLRGFLFDVSIPSALAVMTGVAFVLFTNYMITDPGTSPMRPLPQIAFGGGTALLYGVITALHISYGLFFALLVVCLARGLFLWSLHISQRVRAGEAAVRSVTLPGGVPEGGPAVPVLSPAGLPLDGKTATPGTRREAVGR